MNEQQATESPEIKRWTAEVCNVLVLVAIGVGAMATTRYSVSPRG